MVVGLSRCGRGVALVVGGRVVVVVCSWGWSWVIVGALWWSWSGRGWPRVIVGGLGRSWCGVGWSWAAHGEAEATNQHKEKKRGNISAHGKAKEATQQISKRATYQLGDP